MSWLIRTLGRAVVAGIGWKLGADAYEAVKKRLQRKSDLDEGDEEAGAVATETAGADGQKKRRG